MKRSKVVWRSLLVPAALLAASVGTWLLGWWPWGDPSVVIANSNHNRKVENGSAYDRAAIDLGDARRLVLPHAAVVRRSPAAIGRIELFMEKTLAFGGHPPERMSIRDARRNMGCTAKAEGGILAIATFGEWDSRIEGGAYTRLLAVVPEGLEVELVEGLSGPNSAGREWHGEMLTRPPDAKGGWWYGPASPARGWVAISDRPDRNRTAKGMFASDRSLRVEPEPWAGGDRPAPPPREVRHP